MYNAIRALLMFGLLVHLTLAGACTTATRDAPATRQRTEAGPQRAIETEHQRRELVPESELPVHIQLAGGVYKGWVTDYVHDSGETERYIHLTGGTVTHIRIGLYELQLESDEISEVGLLVTKDLGPIQIGLFGSYPHQRLRVWLTADQREKLRKLESGP